MIFFDGDKKNSELKNKLAETKRQLKDVENELSELRESFKILKEERDKYSQGGLLTYCADGLATWNKSVDFMENPKFSSAYKKGMFSGHVFGGEKNVDIHLEYRVAVVCWAAEYAKKLNGDFVECGVNTGILSLAVCDYIDFASLDKNFYLFDTFNGIPEEQLVDVEVGWNRADENKVYPDCFEIVTENFKDVPNARLVRGKVPDTLNDVQIDKVAYLSIDMNAVYPEKHALSHFWPKLVSGGIVVFDDYGWLVFGEQKKSHDEFARQHGVEILNLPTGQGLLIKP